jgi:hypothetical protein
MAHRAKWRVYLPLLLFQRSIFYSVVLLSWQLCTTYPIHSFSLGITCTNCRDLNPSTHERVQHTQ